MHDVVLAQCAYGLQLPGSEPHMYCRKLIRFSATYPQIALASRSCPGVSKTHQHEHARGSRRVNWKTITSGGSGGLSDFIMFSVLCEHLTKFWHTSMFEGFGSDVPKVTLWENPQRECKTRMFVKSTCFYMCFHICPTRGPPGKGLGG